MNGINSYIETEDIILSVKCSEDSIKFLPSFEEEQNIGQEAVFRFESFTC